MRRFWTLSAIFALILTLSSMFIALSQNGTADAQWTLSGHDSANSRSQPNENVINSDNAASLQTKWVFTTDSDVSATPTVADGAVYFPDWGGNLYAVQAKDGSLIWSHKISEYDNFAG